MTVPPPTRDESGAVERAGGHRGDDHRHELRREQGTSTVTFNGTAATPTTWSATSITVPVPAGATTGNVVVTVGGVASNGVAFTGTAAAADVTSLAPSSGPVGTAVTITGTNFGASRARAR